MRISAPFDISGYFWLPEKSDQRLPGVLHVSEDGETTLEVIGVFGDDLAALTDTSHDLSRIVGVVENGDLVTLDRCSYIKRTINLGGLSKSAINAKFLLRGVQYDTSEAIVFSKFRFSLEGLDEWLSVTGIRVEPNWEQKTASIQFDPPKEITYCPGSP